jgi:hypothetical protein
MSDKARIGVIGAGWWAVVNHIPVLQSLPDCEVVAVNRLGADELRAVSEKFSVAAAFEDWREMLASVPMDGVVISPHVVHFRACGQRSEGLPCWSSAHTNAAEARALVALAKAKGRQIVVPYGWNFRPFAGGPPARPASGRSSCRAADGQCARRPLAGEPMKRRKGDVRPPASTWADRSEPAASGWLGPRLGLVPRRRPRAGRGSP